MSRAQIADPEQWIPRELFAAYCGEDSGALVAFYDKARDKKKMLVMEASFVQAAWRFRGDASGGLLRIRARC